MNALPFRCLCERCMQSLSQRPLQIFQEIPRRFRLCLADQALDEQTVQRRHNEGSVFCRTNIGRKYPSRFSTLQTRGQQPAIDVIELLRVQHQVVRIVLPVNDLPQDKLHRGEILRNKSVIIVD